MPMIQSFLIEWLWRWELWLAMTPDRHFECEKHVFPTFLTPGSNLSRDRFNRPAGTGAIFLVIPGTSCLATMVLSLRDKGLSPFEIASAVPREEMAIEIIEESLPRRGYTTQPGVSTPGIGPNPTAP